MGGKINIKWTADKSVDLAGYRVYWAATSAALSANPREHMLTLGPLVPDAAGYVHAQIDVGYMPSGVAMVTAYDTAGNESTWGAQVAWKMPRTIMRLQVTRIELVK